MSILDKLSHKGKRSQNTPLREKLFGAPPKRATPKKTLAEKVLDLTCKEIYRPEMFRRSLLAYDSEKRKFNKSELKELGYNDVDIEQLQKFTNVLCTACNGDKHEMDKLYQFAFYRLIKSSFKNTELFLNLDDSPKNLNLDTNAIEVLFSDENYTILEEYSKKIQQDIITNAQNAIETWQDQGNKIADNTNSILAAVTALALAVTATTQAVTSLPHNSDNASSTSSVGNIEDAPDQSAEQGQDGEPVEPNDSTTIEIDIPEEGEEVTNDTDNAETYTTSENEDEIVTTNDTEGIILAETDKELHVMDISHNQRDLCPSGEALINYIEDPKKVAIPPDMLWIRSGYRGSDEGNIAEDKMFWEYADACNEAGYKFAIYFFSQAINEEEAKEEAEYILKLVEEGKNEHGWGENFTGIIASDIEYIEEDGIYVNRTLDVLTTYDSDGKAHIVSDVAQPWVDCINDAGYVPVIYASSDLIQSTGLNSLEDCYFWAAQWSDYDNLKCSIPEDKLLAWQITSGDWPGYTFDWNIVYPSVLNDAIASVESTINNEEYVATYESNIDDWER